jgi:hypothetical protein
VQVIILLHSVFKVINVRSDFLTERAPNINKPATVYKNNQRENGKYWSRVPDGCLTPGRTGRLTVIRNITLTLTLVFRRCVGYELNDFHMQGLRFLFFSIVSCISSINPYRLTKSSDIEHATF